MKTRAKMRNNVLYIFVLAWVIMLPGYIVAQDTKEKLKSEEVYIIEEYIPTIIEPKKFNTYPKITDTVAIKHDMKYGTLGKKKNIQLKVMPIQAARIKGEPIDKLYNGYAKIAGGNFATILAEASYSTVRNKNYLLGAKINHLSSNDKKFNQFSNSNAEVFGKKFISKKHTLKGGLNYSLDGYEYNKSANYETLNLPVDVKQKYNQYGGNVGFKSFHKDSAKLNFGVDFEYMNFQSAISKHITSTVENIYDLKGFVLSPISKLTYGTAEFKLKTFGLTSFSDTSKNSLSQVSARAVTVNDRLRFEYGFKVFIAHSNGEAADMKFYPDLWISGDVVDNILIPYIHISGSVKRDGYRGTVEMNPFITPEVDLINTMQVGGDLGLKGTLSSNLSYDVQVSYQKIDGLPLFVTDTIDNEFNYFNLIYDSSVSVSSVKLELGYEISDKLIISHKTVYNSYSMKNVDVAWHKPIWDVSLMAEYKLKDKLKIKTEFYLMDGLKARSYVLGKETSVSLPTFYDVNLEMEYNYSSRLSAFLRLNNLASKSYQRWYNYPRYKFNILGGFSFSF